ncbi:MAG: hypothetical protein IH598_03400 [Bacteroidales bacterium]|nr:hypothetical protein [Bacteroidales bacterium]
MKPEQLNPIVTKLHKQIVEILLKLDPGLKKHETETQPSFNQLSILIEQSLPVLNKAGESEQKQLLELTKRAKEYFKLQDNNDTFATCFILINSVTVNGRQFDFQTSEIHEYFKNRYHQMFKKWQGIETDSWLNFFMLDQWVPGFSVNTYLKFLAVRKFDGKIEIERQLFTNENEKLILFDEMEKEISHEFRDISILNQKTFVEQFKKEWDIKEINYWIKRIEKVFNYYALEVRNKYDKLMESFNSLIKILTSEIEQRKNSPPASYIRLPIKDEKQRQEYISFVYFGLNGRCFETTKENFEKIFTPDRSFTKIKWECSMNLFVKLFYGFYNLEVDGVNQFSFPGIADRKTPKLWTVLADKFDIQTKGKTPIASRLPKHENSEVIPRELINYVDFIMDLKKGWKIS